MLSATLILTSLLALTSAFECEDYYEEIRTCYKGQDLPEDGNLPANLYKLCHKREQVLNAMGCVKEMAENCNYLGNEVLPTRHDAEHMLETLCQKRENPLKGECLEKAVVNRDEVQACVLGEISLLSGGALMCQAARYTAECSSRPVKECCEHTANIWRSAYDRIIERICHDEL